MSGSKDDDNLSQADSSLQFESLEVDEDPEETPFNIEDEIPTRRHDMEVAIEKYMKLIRMPETDYNMKENLVTKLCALRIKLHEMNEEIDKTSHFGHSLYKCQDTDSPKVLVCGSCGRRSGWLPIPSLLRSSFYESDMLVCNSCNLHIHRDCLNKPDLRLCPRVDFDKQGKLSTSCERNYEAVVLKICPEIGLAKQNFKCNECNSNINLSNSNICDYDGRYYCTIRCHTGDTSLIPARIIHNWDFIPRAVSKRSLLLINYVRSRPILFNVLQLNSMLYGFVDELPALKKIRKELISMVQYTRLCKQPSRPKLTISQHLMEESLLDCYTLDELINIPQLQKDLIDVHSTLMHHITKVCESCKGKGFYCELCHDKADLLFPFASNIASCPQCSAVYHKNCYHRKNRRCTRCMRLKEKNLRAFKDEENSS